VLKGELEGDEDDPGRSLAEEPAGAPRPVDADRGHPAELDLGRYGSSRPFDEPQCPDCGGFAVTHSRPGYRCTVCGRGWVTAAGVPMLPSPAKGDP